MQAQVIRERALRVLLALLGVLFTAAIYPLTLIVWRRQQAEYGAAMMLSLYFALGILLLIAVRHPARHRSLVAFVAWSIFAHGALMAAMEWRDARERGDLAGVAVLFVIGVALILLAPNRQEQHDRAGVVVKN
jgi:hypothetical protein